MLRLMDTNTPTGFYGVTTTGIFCRDACASRRPRSENVRRFASAREALREGFRPCKRCRPDLASFEPEKVLADKVRALCLELYDKPAELKRALLNLGASETTIARALRRAGFSPATRLVTSARIEEAKRLLIETSRSVLDIALACGFSSVSNFYRIFRRETGMAPGGFRKGAAS